MTLEELLILRGSIDCSKDPKEYNRINAKINYKRNPDRAKAASQKWRKNNPEKVRLHTARWVKDNKEQVNARNREWRKANPEWIKAYYTKRWREKPYFRLKSLYDSRVKEFFYQGWRTANLVERSRRGRAKKLFCVDLCGCTEAELFHHMGKQFFGYSLDHIMPCVAFNLEDPEQVKKCYHYTNLRWIPAEENLKKGRSMPESTESV